ncbi:MAG TPA: hypothetical protein PKD19_01355 [Candidatus Saccharibacteria bacterium]|jgi:hypothetical protein|nr:hypothetical protein [Candidatus Saccharibacteria bacterium]HMR37955.1 hypothetical protein [Candidatus Saccharibacteria bacterium]
MSQDILSFSKNTLTDPLAKALHAELADLYAENDLDIFLPPEKLILYARQCGRAALALKYFLDEREPHLDWQVARVGVGHTPQTSSTPAEHCYVRGMQPNGQLLVAIDPTWNQFLLTAPDVLQTVAPDSLPSQHIAAWYATDTEAAVSEATHRHPHLKQALQDLWNPQHATEIHHIPGTRITYSARRIARSLLSNPLLQ